MPKPEFLVIGRVAGTFGVHGELKVEIESDYPERFKTLHAVFVGGRPYVAEGARLHGRHALVKLKGIDTPEDAATLNRLDMSVALADAVKLEPGQHFVYEIEGLDVETVAGEPLGRVAEVLKTGANDVYVVRNDAGDEILLPAIPQVIRQVDVEHGKLIVELMDGLR